MNKRDTFYFWYFVLHIPITILIDSCLVVPKEYRHWAQATLVDFHVGLNKDFLLENPPLWLQVFGFVEIFFQLPVFFYAAYKLYTGRKQIHVILALYGFNASLTTAVCLTYVLKEARDYGLTDSEKWNLFGLYLPYVLIPGFMMVDSGCRLSLWIGKYQQLEADNRTEKMGTNSTTSTKSKKKKSVQKSK